MIINGNYTHLITSYELQIDHIQHTQDIHLERDDIILIANCQHKLIQKETEAQRKLPKRNLNVQHQTTKICNIQIMFTEMAIVYILCSFSV